MPSGAPAYAPAQSYSSYRPQPNYSQPNNSQPAPNYPQPSYSQPSNPQPAYTPASYSSAPAAVRSASQPGWGAQGEKNIVVEYGDTAYSLGQKHGVPASAILSANNLPQGSTLTPGQRLIVPSYQGNSSAQASAPARQTAPQPALNPPRQTAKAPAARGGSHTVSSGETLFSVARQYGVPAGELASANQVGLDYRVRTGERLTIPGEGRAAAAPHTVAAARPAPVAEPMRAVPQVQAEKPADEPKYQPVVARAEPKPAIKDEVDDAPSVTSGGTDFRWPVRGRVISAFGSKPNGTTNDGLNLSVPEGTPIKAAEGGVVAYAGNELKGFGNLVLIRHQGEWVTAYAHASEILVKRGDVVRRGQIIAKSGKTGNVAAPQLHFEVRRGATPVDPMGHLPQG